MKNHTGIVAHYGDTHLIFRLKTADPAHLHKNIMLGLNVAQKLALLAEDLTKEEKEAILALNELSTMLLPQETCLEMMQQEREACGVKAL